MFIEPYFVHMDYFLYTNIFAGGIFLKDRSEYIGLLSKMAFISSTEKLEYCTMMSRPHFFRLFCALSRMSLVSWLSKIEKGSVETIISASCTWSSTNSALRWWTMRFGYSRSLSSWTNSSLISKAWMVLWVKVSHSLRVNPHSHGPISITLSFSLGLCLILMIDKTFSIVTSENGAIAPICLYCFAASSKNM